MTRLVVLVLGMTLLAGCTSVLLKQEHWTGGPQQMFARDENTCLQQAMGAQFVGDPVSRRIMFQTCMQARGWREVGNEGW